MFEAVRLTRAGSLAEAIELLIDQATISVDAALYRFNHPRLAQALEAAQKRGVNIRMVLDRNKYQETAATRALMSQSRVPFRLLYGRRGPGTKMHHKFVIIDSTKVLTRNRTTKTCWNWQPLR